MNRRIFSIAVRNGGPTMAASEIWPQGHLRVTSKPTVSPHLLRDIGLTDFLSIHRRIGNF